MQRTKRGNGRRLQKIQTVENEENGIINRRN
jgi:hypothetical protein